MNQSVFDETERRCKELELEIEQINSTLNSIGEEEKKLEINILDQPWIKDLAKSRLLQLSAEIIDVRNKHETELLAAQMKRERIFIRLSKAA